MKININPNLVLKSYSILYLFLRMAEEFNEEEEMFINQEYKIWKKDAPFLYDLLILHSTDWPSYTFQFLPQTTTTQDFTSHYAISSSNCSEIDQCQLLKLRIDIPNENKCQKFMESRENKVKIIERITHPGQINRARYCPGNSAIIASATGKGDINLMTMKESVAKLVAHTSQGYGLAWNAINPNILLSGATDKRICIWDLEASPKSSPAQKMLPISQILHHSAPVEDVAWHKHHPSIFASCSDDRLVMLWDLRFRAGGQTDKKPLFEIVAHTDEVYSLDFSLFNEFIFASGSGDQNVSIWDMRNLTRATHTLKGEKNSIIKVQWSPFTASVLASGGYGRTVDIWDLSKEKETPETPPGLLFRHSGHRSKVIDFDWNANQKLLIGSIEEANCLHLWEMSKQTYYEEDETK